MKHLVRNVRAALFVSVALSAAGFGCSSTADEEPSSEEIGRAEEAASVSGVAWGFTRVTHDLAFKSIVCSSPGGVPAWTGLLADGSGTASAWSDTGYDEYRLDFSTLTSTQRTNWSNAIAAGTARIRTGTLEVAVALGAATSELQYTTTIEKNGSVVQTCTGSAAAVGLGDSNVTRLCEYTPTSYSDTDVYLAKSVSMVKVICLAATSFDQGGAQTRLVSMAETNGYTAAIWRP